MAAVESHPPLSDVVGIAQRLRDEFRVGAAERDLKGQFPHDQCASLRASGLLGLTVSHQYGGLGGNFASVTRVASRPGGRPSMWPVGATASARCF